MRTPRVLPPGTGVATVERPPPVPPVPADLSGGARGGAVVRWARGINAALRGEISATLKVTLATSVTASVLYDGRISIYSFIGLMPLTANASQLLDTSPPLWFELSQGQVLIHHASSPNTDLTFLAAIIGA